MNAYRRLSELAAIGALALAPWAALAQHSDVRFSYADGRITLAPSDGQPFADRSVWLSEWDTDGFFQQTSSQPGFASEAVDGFGVGPGDVIAYHVLDDLVFWDGAGFAPPAPGVQVRINNNLGPETLVSAESGQQPGSTAAPYVNGIGDAFANGDFHSHVAFDLEPNHNPSPAPPPALGAYGLKLSLTTDATGVSDSDPLFIVFNFGLSELAFDEAAQQFAALLAPAPTGDFNGDGEVGLADYVVWRDGLGTLYDAEDYADWRANYGRPAPGAPATTTVPEPAAALLWSLGLTLVLTQGARKEGRP